MKRVSKRSILVMLLAGLLWSWGLAGCLQLSAQTSEGFTLFSNIYRTIKSQYVDEIDGTTLILAAEKTLQEVVAGDDSEEALSLQPVLFDLASELEEKSDGEMLQVFADYLAALVESIPEAEPDGEDLLPESDEEGLLSEHELTLIAIDGMFESLGDPHSRFLREEELRDLTTTVEGSFGGLGMYVNKRSIADTDKQYLEVISPMPGTPADRAGIHAGDFIVLIESEPTATMSVDEAVMRLRGKPGTPVHITVLRGEDIRFTRTITRERIEVPTITEQLITEEEIAEVTGEDAPGPIGYIRLILFTANLSHRLEEALRTQTEAGAVGFILDLRGNAGGLLESAVDTTGLFFDEGSVVSLRGRQKELETVYEARDPQIVPDEVPLVLLINGATASAAEIFAGAMKDRDRALLVGETSYGKGSVQQIYMFGEAGIRLTTARYYTPSGISIDGTGVDPHEVISVEYTPEELTAYSDLLEEGVVTHFITQYAGKELSDATVEQFIEDTLRDHEHISRDLLAQLVWSELYRVRENESRVYDLRYDQVLRGALPHVLSDVQD